jgi:glyoxylase-like metal-dependent hydrolase (beta-lactamase superfamily II)
MRKHIESQNRPDAAGRSRRRRLLGMVTAIAAGAALAVGGRVLAQQNQDFSKIEIDAVQVRDNVYMLVGAGGNTTIQFGNEGVMVVDTQFAPMSDKILRSIRQIAGDRPIRYVVNTHVHGDHIGGNEAIAKAGRTRAGGNVVGDLGAGATSQASVIAHENVLNRMSMPAPGQPQVPFAAWPTETFANDKKEMIFNNEAVQIIHEPNAHTDGDSLVFFRRSDVVATGDLFTTTMFPFIDAATGGSINGYVNALNAILDITVASNVNEGGTMVIPGHGRLSDEQDVIEYRDMATIVRDRIREYVKRGLTLEQVREKKPTLDFDPRYGTPNGFWTPAMFVDEIYKEMAAEKAAAAPARNQNRNQNQKPNQKGSGQ